MRRLILPTCLALTLCLGLAGCGADGRPEPPSKSGLSISGDAQIGVVVK
jgi:hypothetical protein